MKEEKATPEMGIILCSRCGEIIDTLDTEKVSVFYSLCKEPSCLEAADTKEEALA